MADNQEEKTATIPKDLTPEQWEKVEEYKAAALKDGTSTERAFREQAEAGVVQAYAGIGLEAPKTVLWASGPHEGMVLSYLIEAFSPEAKTTEDFLQLKDPEVRAALLKKLQDNMVPEGTEEEKKAALDREVRNHVNSCCWGQHDLFWLTHWEFFLKELNVECKPEDRKVADGILDIARASGWWWPYEHAVVLSERALSLSLDDENRLHNENGAAIEYADGTKLFVWHGTRVPAEWILDKDNVDPALGLTWDNIEQRRILTEILGWGKVLQHVKCEVIDENPDPEIGTLIRAKLPDTEGYSHFLRVLCGTNREFALCVPETVKTAQQAQNEMWDDENYAPEFRT